MANELDVFLGNLTGTLNDVKTAVSSVDNIISNVNKTASTVAGVANNGINVPVNIGLDPQTKNALMIGGLLIAILLVWAIFFK